jgi:PAS domain S-box-containing protein
MEIDVGENSDADQSFTRLFQASPAPFLVLAADAPLFTIREVNEAYLAATMTTRESLVGRGVFDAFPDNPNDPSIQGVSALRASLERVLATRKPDRLPGLKYDVARPDGSFEERWWSPVNSPVLNEDGEVEALIHNANDVTDEYRAEAALRASEARLRELNETLEQKVAERTVELDRVWRLSTDIMLVAAFDGTIRSVNPAWATILGWVDQELLGRNFLELVHPDDREATIAEMGKLDQGLTTFRFENRYAAKDGGYRHISWTAAPEANLIHAVGRDVTAEREQAEALRQAEEALRQSQKMEAMGTLTGGVAHDFNNLLTPIIGALDLLQRREIGGEREQRLITGAIQSADRAKTLVQRLLAFARRQPLQPTAVDIGGLVHGMADLLGSTTGPQIRVVVEAADDLPPARADLNQLEMALLNLGVNARDAMPDGGTLRITATRESVRSERSQLKCGDYVRLSVADTGTGMDEATLARAVEPFFSTKGIGKGTGLGLSMAHGLAAQLGGALTIQSKQGLGTNIELWLPISAVAADMGETGAAARLDQAEGLVLLVDDEEVVRTSTADMLEDLGYEVRQESSAEAALALVDHGLVPDLLVTDHLMPGMSGVDLVRALRARLSALPVLIVSGYAEAEGIDPDLPRLTKPFRSAELEASIARLNVSTASSN